MFIMQCLRQQDARKEWKRWFNVKVQSYSTDCRGFNDNTIPKQYNKIDTMGASNGPWNSDTVCNANALKRSINNEDKKKPPQQIELCKYTDGAESSLVVANTTELGNAQSAMNGADEDEQVEMAGFLENLSSNLASYLQKKTD